MPGNSNLHDSSRNKQDEFYTNLQLAEEYVTPGGMRFCASAATNGISRSYDSFDRPIGYAFSVNGEPKSSIGYAYEDDGDLARLVATNSIGRSFSVAYTNVAGYSYGYAITTPNGDTVRRVVGRDEYRRSLATNCVTYFNSFLVDSNLYAFDALSRPVSRTTGTTGVSPVASTFAYNNRSEVVSAAIGTNLFTHAYDDIGNHLLFVDNSVTNTFIHNQLNQMVGRGVSDAPPTAFAYAPDGGLYSDGTWSYAYDAEDQLTSVTSSSLTNGAIRVLNTYDYRHRRTVKAVQRLSISTAPPPSPPITTQEWEPTETRTFVYDDWNLIHETVYTVDSGVTNVTEIQYFWGLDLSGTIQGAGGVGGLLAVSRDGQFYFPTFDNNGNVTKYIDESGNVVSAYEYDDFGRTISQSASLADFFCHRFSTKYYDPEIGLYYYGYRSYSPDWRIWLNRDPIEEAGGNNLYAFCGNNPAVNYDDDGCAYFAKRVLVGQSWSEKFSVNSTLDTLEWEWSHEHLFYGTPDHPLDDVGFFGDGKVRKDAERGRLKYVVTSSGYNDCVMRKAVAQVSPESYNLVLAPLPWFDNCQSYAAKLRAKYDELLNVESVLCECFGKRKRGSFLWMR